MWKLIARGARGTPFEEIGTYGSLTEAADAILRMENDSCWVFFNVPVSDYQPSSDAELLSRLTYQGKAHYYVLTREALSKAHTQGKLVAKTSRPKRAITLRNGHRTRETR